MINIKKSFLDYITYIYIYELSLLENPANTYMRYTEHWTAVSTLLGLINSAYRDLHHWRSNQQPQNAEAETLLLGHRFISHISDAELTSHSDNVRPFNLIYLEGTYSLQRTRPTPGLRLHKSVLWIHIKLTSWAENRTIFNQLILSYINNLKRALWFEVFLSNTDNYKVPRDSFYLIIIICLHTVIWFPVFNNDL